MTTTQGYTLSPGEAALVIDLLHRHAAEFDARAAKWRKRTMTKAAAANARLVATEARAMAEKIAGACFPAPADPA